MPYFVSIRSLLPFILPHMKFYILSAISDRTRQHLTHLQRSVSITKQCFLHDLRFMMGGISGLSLSWTTDGRQDGPRHAMNAGRTRNNRKVAFWCLRENFVNFRRVYILVLRQEWASLATLRSQATYFAAREMSQEKKKEKCSQVDLHLPITYQKYHVVLFLCA